MSATKEQVVVGSLQPLSFPTRVRVVPPEVDQSRLATGIL